MPISPAELEAAYRAVVARPGHPRYAEVAMALIAAGRFADAATVAEQGLAVLPQPQAQIALADANLQLGRVEHARATIERFLAVSPNHTAALRILGECHLQGGRPDLAGPLLQRAARGMPPDARAQSLWTSLGAAAAGPPPSAPAPASPGGVLELDDAPVSVGSAAGGADLFGSGAIELDTEDDPFGGDALEFDAPPLQIGGGPEPEGALELDLGGPAPSTGVDPATTPSYEPPPPAAPRPASDPAARRRAGSSEFQPYAPPHLAKERRQRSVAVLIVVVLLAAAGGGFYFWKTQKEEKLRSALATAAVAAAQDTVLSLATAEAAVQEALELDAGNAEALGLGAYVAARRFTGFEAPTDTLITAQERIARTEVLEQVPLEATLAKAMILVEQERYGEVVTTLSPALAAAPRHPGLLWTRAQAEQGLERLPLALESLEQAHASDPGFLPLVPTLASALVRAGRAEEAVELLERVVEGHPDHLPSVILLLTHGLRSEGRQEALLKRAEGLEQSLRTAATPTDLCRFNLAAARLAMAAGDPDRARRFENGASIADADAACRAQLGEALLARERPCAAVDVLAGVAESLGADDAERARSLTSDAAGAALRCGRTSRAASLIGALPEGQEKSLLEVRLEAADGRLAEAQAKLDPLVKARQVSSMAWAVSAHLATLAADLDGARKAALRAAARPDRDPAHRLEIARLLLDTGEARQAVSLLPAPRRGEVPSHAQLALRGEALLLAASRAGPGLPELERAIAMNPDAGRAVSTYLSRAPARRIAKLSEKLGSAQAAGLELRVLLEEGELKKAATHLEAHPPAKDEPLRLSLGRALVQIGGGDASALQALEELSLANKHSAEAQTSLGTGRHRLGKLGDAITAYEAAIALEPSSVEARVGRAEALVDGATNPDDALAGATAALAWVERLAASDRQLARAHAALAIARAELTDPGGARQALGRALALAPDAPRVRFAEARVTEAGGDTRQALHLYQLLGKRPGGELALLRVGMMGVDEVASPEVSRAALERFLELQPGHAQASRARQLLSALP
ncbi:MAG: tetratricopeptide repeat protein [Deltaproteobacteria bacterium]|nr:tetratricopeptide repeat protein [Deltaproteobacteria bacterium]